MLGAVVVLVVIAAGFVKGAIGFGFPTLATPLLALVVDVPAAVAVLDRPQPRDGRGCSPRGRAASGRRRGGGGAAGVRRRGHVRGDAAPGGLSAACWPSDVLGAFVLLFVVLERPAASRRRIPPGWERWLAPVSGSWPGSWAASPTSRARRSRLLLRARHGQARVRPRPCRSRSWSQARPARRGRLLRALDVAPGGGLVVLTAAAFAGFAAGLRVQDRLEQAAFNRAVLVLLAVLGLGLIARAALSGSP